MSHGSYNSSGDKSQDNQQNVPQNSFQIPEGLQFSTMNQNNDSQQMLWYDTLMQRLGGNNMNDHGLSFFDNGATHPPQTTESHVNQLLQYMMQQQAHNQNPYQQQNQNQFQPDVQFQQPNSYNQSGQFQHQNLYLQHLQQQQQQQQQQQLLAHQFNSSDSGYSSASQPLLANLLSGRQEISVPPEKSNDFSDQKKPSRLSNSFTNRSNSDLGMRMDDFASNLGGLPGVSYPNAAESSYSTHGTSQDFMHPKNNNEDGCQSEILKNLIKNASNNNSQLLSDASVLLSSSHYRSVETPNVDLDDLQRAPGTPISNTPPPQTFEQESGSSLNKQQKSKSKKGKKTKQPNNPNDGKKLLNASDSTNESFSFYSSDELKTSITDLISFSKNTTANTDAPTPASKAPLSPKLSYSDVLNSAQKNPIKVNPSLVNGQKENLGCSRKLTSTHGSSKKESKKYLSSSNSPVNRAKMNKTKDPFASKVGLDVFTTLTDEELAATCDIQDINLEPYEFKFRDKNSNVNDASITSYTDWKFEERPSVPSSPQQLKNKLEMVLNNNKITSNLKQDLKESNFINNDLSKDIDVLEESANSLKKDVPKKESEKLEKKRLVEDPVEDCLTVSCSESPHHAKTNLVSKGTSSASSFRSRNTNASSNKTGKGKIGKIRRRSTSLNRNQTGEWQEQVQTILQALLTYLLVAVKWLYELVSDVVLMSSRLFLEVWTNSYTFISTNFIRLHETMREKGSEWYERFMNYWIPNRKPPEQMDALHFLSESIPMPQTGEEAMKRLLACKGRDNYSILGVKPNERHDVLVKYYRRQAFLVHPDKNRMPGADEAFKILQHAFEELEYPEGRAKYDEKLKSETRMRESWDRLSVLLKNLEMKLKEASNMIRCTNCNGKHLRKKCEDRPLYAARYCASCNIRHASKEGDIWAESKYRGWFFYYFFSYYSCMDGGVYDISEWARCQYKNLKHLKANMHDVQYRIAQSQQQQQQQQKKNKNQKKDHPANIPTDPEVEEFFNQLYRENSKMNQTFSHSAQSSPGHSRSPPPNSFDTSNNHSNSRKRASDKVKGKNRR